MRMPNFYVALEIPNFSDIKVVEQAYRRAAMKHHPDRGGDAEMMKIINAGLEVLRKDKAQYDALLHQALNPAPVVVRFYYGYGMDGTSNYYTSATVTSW